MDTREELFSKLRGLLAQYSPPLTVRRDDGVGFDLWSERPLVIEGRKRKDVFFAAAIIQKSYVGFYYMPVYAEPEIKAFFSPELLALLKGKSCFHVRRLTPGLEEQIAGALMKGFELYRERGWV